MTDAPGGDGVRDRRVHEQLCRADKEAEPDDDDDCVLDDES